MTLDNQKENFSYAYAHAIAATARVSTSEPKVDDDSIDLTFMSRATGTVVRSPRLDAQLKCADQNSLTITATHIHYPLKLKNYDELRPTNNAVPIILLVVLVPHELHQWLEWTTDELRLRKAGYWMSLRGEAATTNTSNVTVQVPLANQFSVQQLTDIMARIGRGGFP